MKIGFSSQRREMLLFLTPKHRQQFHQHGRRDVTCKPAKAYLQNEHEIAKTSLNVTSHLLLTNEATNK